jgi:hypothetical protein
MTHDAQPLPNVVPCLSCGKRGRHKHIGFASSRSCVETGKLCDDCYDRIMEEKHSRGWFGWPARTGT